MHAASGLFSRTMELLAFASRQFAPETMDFSVRFTHAHFVQFSLLWAKRLVYPTANVHVRSAVRVPIFRRMVHIWSI